jgi:dTDP-4-dehydrorhamnose 3,5-epimerase
MISNDFAIKGLIQITSPHFIDGRGFFKEVFRTDTVESFIKNPFTIRQMNHSHSIKNTLRGIHVAPWNKLIYVTKGVVQSVIVDPRRESNTYGEYQSFEIGDNNKTALFIPAGCGNAYLVLSENADYIYLTDKEWSPNKEIGISWNDPQLNVMWKLEGKPLLSDKDKNNLPLSKITFT